jgi:DNA-binding IclR family transcriptional regulator
VSLILGHGTTIHRRQLGPFAWAVLEEMALSASRGADGLPSPLGARQLAERLGINKDTAAKAIGRLVAAGLVERDEPRAAGSGRFRAGGYLLRLPAGMAASAPVGRRRTPEDVAQLSLLAHG